MATNASTSPRSRSSVAGLVARRRLISPRVSRRIPSPAAIAQARGFVHRSSVSGSGSAATVNAGAVAVLAEVAGAAIDVARAPSAQRRQAGATGAVAETAVSIRATGDSAVTATATVPVGAGLAAATGLCGAAGSSPAGRACTSPDEEVAGAGAAGFAVGARRPLWLAAERPGDAVLDGLIALQTAAALWGLPGDTRYTHLLTHICTGCLAVWLPATLLAPFLSILAFLVAFPGRGVLRDRGQAKQTSGKETKARASCGVGGEGLRQTIETEVIHCGTPRADERTLRSCPAPSVTKPCCYCSSRHSPALSPL